MAVAGLAGRRGQVVALGASGVGVGRLGSRQVEQQVVY